MDIGGSLTILLWLQFVGTQIDQLYRHLKILQDEGRSDLRQDHLGYRPEI